MTTETKQEGWMARGLTAVCEKLFAWICQHPINLTPADYQKFLTYSNSGWADALMCSKMVYPRQYKEETPS